MANLIEMLRQWTDRDGQTTPLGQAAAEEIENLRDDVARLHSDKMRYFEALLEMRSRDDRNGSLHENYRKIIDNALNQQSIAGSRK